MENNSQYRALSSPESRQTLVEDMKRVRREAAQIVQLVPKNQWYQPRYHGWSLGALLGHLSMMDHLTLLLIQMGVRGVAIPLPLAILNVFNDTTSRFMRQRGVEETLSAIQQHEPRLCQYVMQLPAHKLNRRVYDPAIKNYLTVEQAAQEFFFLHWQGHLQTVRQADDKRYYEPPKSSVV